MEQAESTENATSIVKRVTAVLAANGYGDGGTSARGRKFLVNGGVDAVVTISWGPSSPEDHELLAGCADVLREAGLQVEARPGGFLQVRA